MLKTLYVVVWSWCDKGLSSCWEKLPTCYGQMQISLKFICFIDILLCHTQCVVNTLSVYFVYSSFH